MKSTQRILAFILADVAGMTSAALIQWNGAVSADFEDGDNWVGGVAPANDLVTDTAYFTGMPPANQPELTADRSIAGVRFDSSGWTLGGSHALTLGIKATGFHRDNGVILNNATTNTISCNLNGSPTVSTYTASSGGLLILSGVVVGSSFSQDYGSAGVVRLAGSRSNAITNQTNQGGWYEFAKTDGAVAMLTGSSVVEIGIHELDFRWLESNQYSHPPRIKPGIYFNAELKGNKETFDRFYGSGRVTFDLAGGTITFVGPSTLPVLWNHWDGAPTYPSKFIGPGTIFLTASGDFNPRRATHASNPGYDLDISATITAGVSVASVSIARLERLYEPTSFTRFSAPAGNPYVQDTRVASGRGLIVENASGSATGKGNVYVYNTDVNTNISTLAGSGIIAPAAGNKVFIQNKGRIAPGYGYKLTDSTRIATLTIQSDVVFETGSELQFDIGATTGDSLSVLGALSLTGAPSLAITTLAEPAADVYTLSTFASRIGTVGATTGVPENYKLLVKDDRIVLQYIAPGTIILLQ